MRRSRYIAINVSIHQHDIESIYIYILSFVRLWHSIDGNNVQLLSLISLYELFSADAKCEV